jgi:chitinase
MADLSPEARARAVRTADVAAVFAANADVILTALADVPAGHVLVAVVDQDHAFDGTHHVHTEMMVERVPELEADGWAMVFPLGTTRADIERRTGELADIARQRIAVIDRITARRGE